MISGHETPVRSASGEHRVSPIAGGWHCSVPARPRSTTAPARGLLLSGSPRNAIPCLAYAGWLFPGLFVLWCQNPGQSRLFEAASKGFGPLRVRLPFDAPKRTQGAQRLTAKPAGRGSIFDANQGASRQGACRWDFGHGGALCFSRVGGRELAALKHPAPSFVDPLRCTARFTARGGEQRLYGNGRCRIRPGHAETYGLHCLSCWVEIVAIAQGSPLSGIDSTRGAQVATLQPK